MNKNLCEIVCIIDKSGSMGSIRTDAIGGFNSFLAEQRKLPGDAVVTLVLFDDKTTKAYEGRKIQDTEPLGETSYIPGGGTALLDAVGTTIDSVGKRLADTAESSRPGKVIVAILTDGEENSSLKYTYAQITERIDRQTNVYKWEFLFLAANQDAIASAANLHIQAENAVAFNATAEGTRIVFASMASEVSERRRKS